MKYMLREQKGTYGYIKKQTVFEIIKTIILFLMAFGIFFIGYYTLGTKKSLWSIIAVLSLLPASKSLVGVIMLLRFKSLTASEYERFSNAAGSLNVLYENILTTSEKTYYLPVICYVKGTLTCLGYLKQEDIAKLNTHLQNVLKSAGHKDITIKIYNKEDEFINRLQKMNESFTNEKSNFDAISSTIKAVSL